MKLTDCYENLEIVSTPKYVVADVYKSGEYAVIVKPTPKLKIDGASFTSKLQLSRCIDSQKITESALPELSIPQRFYVANVDGRELVIKECEWIDDVTPLSEMDLTSILKDKDILDSLEKVFGFAVSQFLMNGKKFDFINPLFDRNDVHPFIMKLLGSIRNKNVFIGKRNGSEKIIFVDSDWYTRIDEIKFDFRQIGIPFSIFLINYLGLLALNSILNFVKDSETAGGISIRN